MIRRYFPTLTFAFTALLSGLCILTTPLAAHAGCGCEKPPPAPAAVRPNATYAGKPVTLFNANLQAGQTYEVTFTALNGQSQTISAVAVNKRDLANGVYKPQLIVNLPALPLGPIGISVQQAGQSGALFTIADDLLTLVPSPISVPAQVGEFRHQNFQFAVSRAGVVYLSLSLNAVTLPMVFQAQAKGYPLRFSSDDVVFYNTQGFLMQLLDRKMPGLGSTVSSSSSDSDTLHYSRHEFSTFYLQHAEHDAHATDPTDGNWHLNGSRHIDHDHLVLAIAGTVNGGAPAPGATAPFEFVFKTFSLFHHGLVGASYVELKNAAQIDSYNSTTGQMGAQGDVRSNGTITLKNSAIVNGDATGLMFSVASKSLITGSQTITTQPFSFMPIAVPKELPDLGDIALNNFSTQTLVGPASYKIGKIHLRGNARLIIDNTAGPVTLYIMKDVSLTNVAQIVTLDTNPENFALYMVKGGDVVLSKEGVFHGVVYGPESTVDLTQGGQFFGAFVGNIVRLRNAAQIHYDTALRGE